MANEQEHANMVVEHYHNNSNNKTITNKIGETDETERKLMDLYRQSVQESGVRIIQGDKLGVHHRIANFWQENPFKMLAIAAVPSVGLIFYGRSGAKHLQLSHKILQTRVIGQFAVISLMLGLMGFKEYMDRNGTFITQVEADRRVQRIEVARADFLARLEQAKRLQKEQHDILIHATAHKKNMLKNTTTTNNNNNNNSDKQQHHLLAQH
eukprot:CAMPEP_0118705074 /NCGR_PEP_ID=MMETSP0800-20121206/19644_1 /TAXON_ID=210618 ORGANISM="Striatella unipunctata, Strain CCMP2910" /NCGR_SAMPLE_ID=MMETSP0800 /ASSEMBLY_ACC=CAM_ASM_000638 /LENGTH=209 /DNA_ID=CAMNT_0006607145 /DNA_START=168 /DNA_END=797 /DNA_ORIENTATION=-